MENWKPVPGWEGMYEVSDQGRVVRLLKNGDRRPLRGSVIKSGHRIVRLSRPEGDRRELVHRLVLFAFSPTDRKDVEGCHNDGDPSNNILSNLRWGTRRENCRDEVLAGRHWQTKKTHCLRGHEFTEENTRHYINASGNPSRSCRECYNTLRRARRAAKRHNVDPDAPPPF